MLALHDPKEGYYATRDPLGRAGDFVTAPEVSQMFGELVGLWTAQAWRDQGAPSPARLIELGPGRGQIQYLASLFSPDAPNDVAPGGFNDPAPAAGLATSPLPPSTARTGFRWDETGLPPGVEGRSV